MSVKERIFIGKFHVKQIKDNGECTISMLPMSCDEIDALAGIVRCKNCELCFDKDTTPLCARFAINNPDESEASHGTTLYPTVELEGFCSWGVRDE